MIEIARQDRPSLYDPWADRPAPLVDREPTALEVRGRLDADGAELDPYRLGSCPALPDGVEAVAVCLLHADLDPAHEQAGRRPSCAPRGSTCTLLARGVARVPRVRAHGHHRRQRLPAARRAGRTSRGLGRRRRRGAGDDLGRRPASPSTRRPSCPAALLLSGPAGGVRAAAEAAAWPAGSPTRSPSTWAAPAPTCASSAAARPSRRPSARSAGFPVRLPSLDVHTIGAGGGSIARIDAGGALVVGPRVGRRRSRAGLLRPGRHRADGDRRRPGRRPHPGRRRLRRARARSTVDAARRGARRAPGVDADGRDRRGRRRRWSRRCARCRSSGASIRPGLALVAFGGAGPLHACALADALGMPAVIVPAAAGVLSAVGLLGRAAAARRWCGRWPDAGGPRRARRGARRAGRRCRRGDGGRALAGERRRPSAVEVTIGVDCRYAGQSHELRVATVADFHAEHQRAQRLRPARRPRSRSSPCGPSPTLPGRRSPTCRASGRRWTVPVAARRPSPGPGRRWPSRLHHLGARRVARADGPLGVARAASERVVTGCDARPGRAAGADRPARPASPTRWARCCAAAAFSPNIKERADCSAALFTADGELLVQAEHIPVHLGSMPASVAAAIARRRHGALAPGRAGRSSTTRSPAAPTSTTSRWSRRARVDGRARRVGRQPGPPRRRRRRGAGLDARRRDRDRTRRACASRRCGSPPRCGAVLVANSRTPEERAGDLDAQVGANVVGVRAAGRARRRSRSARSLDYGERRMRAALAALPDGTWRVADVLDSVGPRPDQQRPATHPVRRVAVDGDAITFDFTGTDAAARRQRQRRRGGDRVGGRLRAALGARPDDPGQRRRHAPGAGRRAGRARSSPATCPAAVGAGNVEVSQRVADVCLGALGPGRARAGAGARRRGR